MEVNSHLHEELQQEVPHIHFFFFYLMNVNVMFPGCGGAFCFCPFKSDNFQNDEVVFIFCPF
jgi:hypothetical protein